MHSVVVFVDDRPEAAARVREAAALAQRERALLTLLAAIPAMPLLAWVAPVPAPGSPRLLQAACERECEGLLRRLAELVPAGLPVTLSARRGYPHAVLVHELRERGHDLVVLGPERPGLLGLVARRRRSRFLRRCPARVLVVPRGREALGGARARRRSVAERQAWAPLSAWTRRGART